MPPRTGKEPSCFVGARLHKAGNGRGEKMVVLPYKDSLLLFSRYLQQLVMESLGGKTWTVRLSTKELLSMETRLDRSTRLCPAVARRCTILLTFIEVLEDRQGSSQK